jgi:glycosidase
VKNALLFLSLILLLSFCKKEDTDNDPIDPPPPDTTSFSIPSTEEIVMYEVNLRALSQGGDLQGVTDRLDEIRELGVNVIWLMPIHPIGQINTVNSPYCVRNYEEVNPEFGSLNDLKQLVDEAHERGIAIVLDWVANHTAWDNPWIANTDWYTLDGQGNIVHPPGTNWQDVADLNFGSQEMRHAMIGAMKYWIEAADVDGFRCDAADMIPFDFWQQAIDSVSELKDSLIWLAEGAREDHFAAGFQMNYAWDFYAKIKSVFSGVQPAASLVLVNNQEYFNLPAGKHKLRFTTNHDESAWDATPMVLFNGQQGALAASVATIFLGGIPMIYGSQEVGQEENVPFFSNSPVDWSQNPEMLQEYKDIFKIYNDMPGIKSGEMTTYSTYDVLAFTRTAGQKEILVLDNLRDKTVTFDVPAALENTAWQNAFDGTGFNMPATLELEAYQYRIFSR